MGGDEDISPASSDSYREHANVAEKQKRHVWGDSGNNPLAHVVTNSSYQGPWLAPFGGALEPGLYKPSKFGNPVPLGLSGFALTTFVLSIINLGVHNLSAPYMVIAPALAYGGIVQLCAGMWDIAAGNTFGGTALSSYGGFWIGIAIIFIPGGFEIQPAYPDEASFYTVLGFYIFGWFIFTFLLWLMTLKSTVAFTSLFLSVWIAFICLGCAYLDAANNNGVPNVALERAGGVFGIIAAFIAWYNMLAGLADSGNSFFPIPVAHFPWSEKGRERRGTSKKNDDDASNNV